MVKRYSKEFKEDAVQKMLPPNSTSVKDLSRKLGVPTGTLYAWKNDFLLREQQKNLFFLDCEWNCERGDLISIALVNKKDTFFYEVMECCNPHPWAIENIIPVLERSPVTRNELQNQLRLFLDTYENLEIIADWPEDIMHFCNLLKLQPLTRFGPSKIKFTVDSSLLLAESKIPHNALCDARAICDLYYKKNH